MPGNFWTPGLRPSGLSYLGQHAPGRPRKCIVMGCLIHYNNLGPHLQNLPSPSKISLLSILWSRLTVHHAAFWRAQETQIQGAEGTANWWLDSGRVERPPPDRRPSRTLHDPPILVCGLLIQQQRRCKEEDYGYEASYFPSRVMAHEFVQYIGIVRQEMLHLALSGNILCSIGGTPRLYGKEYTPKYPREIFFEKIDLNLKPATKDNIGIFMRVRHSPFSIFSCVVIDEIRWRNHSL